VRRCFRPSRPWESRPRGPPLISAMEDVMDFRTARAGNSFRVEMDKVGK
jgi:hypothetical protein